MTHLPGALVALLWLSWLLYWGIAARGVKVNLRKETAASRILHVGPLVLCGVFLSVPGILSPWFDRRFLPDAAATHWLGVVVVACGLGFAIWARRHLAGNWSGSVALKAGHDLIRSGPYRFVRHPIYAGLLAAIFGSVIEIGRWRGLVGLAFAIFAIAGRIRAEDALMQDTFGDEYLAYRRLTPALLPFLI